LPCGSWFGFGCDLLNVVPLMAAEGLVTFVRQKLPKTLSAKGFSHLAFALQNQPKPGLQSFALLRSLIPLLLQNLLCPCCRTWPALFWLISAEAGLLTEKKKWF
jgi:hypothetical protein